MIIRLRLLRHEIHIVIGHLEVQVRQVIHPTGKIVVHAGFLFTASCAYAFDADAALSSTTDTVFVKVTRSDGQGVVSKRTATAFGAIGSVATTGQIERAPVEPVPEYTAAEIYAQFSFETPVIRVNNVNGCHRKKIWADIVLQNGDIFAVFCQHQTNRADCALIQSTYDTTPRGITVMKRWEAPPHLSKIVSLLLKLIQEGRVYYDTPRTRNELKNLLPFQL